MNEPSSKVVFLTIDEHRAGQRIDNFLITYFKKLPKSAMYRILRKGEVRVNKKRVEASYRLVEGDMVRIPPVKDLNPEATEAPKLDFHKKKLLENCILFENTQFMVINKPSGIAVHGGSGHQTGLIETLRLMRPDEKFLELVHRLDRETSGCLLVAKKSSTLKQLHALLREHKIKKTYHALVEGKWPKQLNRVNQALCKNQLKSGERVVKSDEEGKAALTTFQLLESFHELSLIAAFPHTGRTHQIRVHTQLSGHPIIGDDKYGDHAVNSAMAKRYAAKRLCLHAVKLSFVLNDEAFSIEAPYDAKFNEILKLLRHEKTLL
ncbi:MAG: pseudouridine synthase, RluA family [Gammaproteobacteria bacterium]|jgi:23S rRNA pseudouridine955/2504/2580 synthase|nr:pseudouridine synthase, RluA family [Gammaproteobacteria bacterium]